MDSTLAELRRRPRRAPLRATRSTRLEIALADVNSKTGNPDRLRIKTNASYARRDWANKSSVSEDALRTTVVQVAHGAADVERNLQDKGKR